MAEQEKGIVGGVAYVSDIDKSPAAGVHHPQLLAAKSHQVANGIESAVVIVVTAKPVGIHQVTQLIKGDWDTPNLRFEVVAKGTAGAQTIRRGQRRSHRPCDTAFVDGLRGHQRFHGFGR
ncbi:hypothetical protein D3C76_1491790 [compost metagenome]